MKVLIGCVLLLASCGLSLGQQSKIDRGKYVVENVAICAQCHTPHADDGQADRARWLEGAEVWLKPAMPVQDWPLRAPRIAGTLPASDEDMVRLLMTGIWKDGNRLRPPMPQFRMTQEDAEAVVAYLRTLGRQKP